MDQYRKHKSKFCFKSFSCSRSLGAHMEIRRRMSFSSKYNATKFSKKMRELLRESKRFDYDYRLRKNPKKNSKFFTSKMSLIDGEEKKCRICDRVFQSCKAMFGHMRLHSLKRTSRKIAKKATMKRADERFAETSGSHIDKAIELKIPVKKKRSMRFCSIPASSPSNSKMPDVKEVEEAAITLMLISRDVGIDYTCLFRNVNCKKLETIENHVSDTEMRNVNCKKLETIENHISDTEMNDVVDSNPKLSLVANEIESKDDDDEEKRISKFECTSCKKSFDTHQALGGHRSSHKRRGGTCCLEVKAKALVDRVEQSKNHQCKICGKMFSSGQAMGGHKRHHLVHPHSPSTTGTKEEQ